MGETGSKHRLKAPLLRANYQESAYIFLIYPDVTIVLLILYSEYLVIVETLVSYILQEYLNFLCEGLKSTAHMHEVRGSSIKRHCNFQAGTVESMYRGDVGGFVQSI